LISALRDAGGPDAQAALRELVDQEGLGADTRQRLVEGLSRTPDPTPETVAKLESLSHDPELGHQAKLGVGSTTYQLRGEHPTRARAGAEFLVQGLTVAATDAETVHFLQALGNAGHPAAIEAVTSYLTHENPELRAAALRALRRVEDPRADGIFARALLGDPDGNVRAAAATYLKQRTPDRTIASTIAARLRAETHLAARTQLIRLAGSWLASSSELRAALEWVAGNDRSDALRGLASQMLQRAA
jgi:HEAT repeat protein